MLSKFWTNPGGWPADALGYVFLARAVQRIGKALYPGTWTGTEAFTNDDRAELLPAIWQAKPRHLERAHFALKRGGLIRNGFAASKPKFTGDEWKRAQEIVAEEAKNAAGIVGRLNGAKRAVQRGSLDGRLRTVLRTQGNGGIFSQPLTPQVWNLDDLGPRFDYCQMDPREPFGIALSSLKHQWVFVSGDDLAALVASIEAEKAPALNKAPVGSPYQQAVAAAQAIVLASPRRRTMAKGEMLDKLQADFALSKKQAEAARSEAIGEPGSETHAAWTRKGPAPEEAEG